MFSSQTYDGTHTLLEQYGYADSTHFNLPDYRECALVGSGTNGTFNNLQTHDVYDVGTFKDDMIGNNRLLYVVGVGSNPTLWIPTSGPGSWAKFVQDDRGGPVTRGKRIGAYYLIKVL